EYYANDCETEINDMTNVEIQQITLKQLIELLQDFTEMENGESDDEESEMSGEKSEESDANKENQEFVLSNPKVRRGKERPPGSKCLKSSHKPNIKEKQQRRCKKCSGVGHYQKKCNKL
ncbi:25937_t:CDS:2, partial [Dentiscutata erythropus]